MTLSTYNKGFTCKCKHNITKHDMVKLCNLLNNKEEYLNLCNFKLEEITGGGIEFNFYNNKKWYKSIRLRCENYPFINTNNVMTTWENNDNILMNENYEFTIFLKSFYGAPLFTLNELKILEECFNEIGILRISKLPKKEDLITNLNN